MYILICGWSYLQATCYRFAEDGANFSLSSDDPTMTGNYVDGDYRLAQSFGLTDLHLAQSVSTVLSLNITTIHIYKDKHNVNLTKNCVFVLLSSYNVCFGSIETLNFTTQLEFRLDANFFISPPLKERHFYFETA